MHLKFQRFSINKIRDIRNLNRHNVDTCLNIFYVACIEEEHVYDMAGSNFLGNITHG